jgi:hypothetical protein
MISLNKYFLAPLDLNLFFVEVMLSLIKHFHSWRQYITVNLFGGLDCGLDGHNTSFNSCSVLEKEFISLFSESPFQLGETMPRYQFDDILKSIGLSNNNPSYFVAKFSPSVIW